MSELLLDAAERGDASAVVAALTGMPEAARRGAAPRVLSAIREASRGYGMPNGALQLAALGVCTLSELEHLPRHARARGAEAIVVLRDRRPEWLPRWVETLMEDEFYWTWFPLVRTLVRDGLCPRPDHPHYPLGMITGLRALRSAAPNPPIQDVLRQDPDLLPEIWHLFELEGGGENSLANYDRFSFGSTWSEAFLALMRDGTLPRERLLDATIAALGRDFNHYRAKWFIDFHDKLAPTPGELTARAAHYLELLHRSTPNVVAFALKTVEKLDRAQPLDDHALLAGLRSRMRSEVASQVRSVIKWISRVAKRNPAVTAECMTIVSEAVLHEHKEVQHDALAWIQQQKGTLTPAHRALLERARGMVAASNTELLASLIGTASAPVPTPIPTGTPARHVSPWSRLAGLDLLDTPGVELESLGPAPFDGTDVPRLHASETVVPAEDLAALIERCASAIENAGDVLEYELALDSIARLADQRPPDFAKRLSPLTKRSAKRLAARGAVPFSGQDHTLDLCAVIHAWATQQVLDPIRMTEYERDFLRSPLQADGPGVPVEWRRSVAGYVARRALAVARQVSTGTALPLLSTPTHASGLIDPHALAVRTQVWVAAQATPDPHDVTLAMLRVAPDDRAKALQNFPNGPAEWVLSLRYALGGDHAIGESVQLWTAAAFARAPFATDEVLCTHHPALGADAGVPARYAPQVTSWESHGHTHHRLRVDVAPAPSLRVDVLPAAFFAEPSADRYFTESCLGPRSDGAYRLAASVSPVVADALAAESACILGANLDWWEAQWANKVLLEPWANPDLPLRDMPRLLLVLGLAAKDPGEHGLASDVAIRAIEDGRLVGDELGATMSLLLPTGLVKPARWARSLKDVARHSAWHTLTVRVAIERVCGASVGVPPRELLELLLELCTECGCAASGAAVRKSLARAGTKGKVGATATALLALQQRDATHATHQAQARSAAYEGRRARAERWGQMREGLS